MPKGRSARRTEVALASLLVASPAASCASGCQSPPPVSLGMSPSAVRERMGAPERIGFLKGKVIERVPAGEEPHGGGRLAYFYRGGAVVWFEGGRVSGVACAASKGDNRTNSGEDH
jgi:hypothetical protein